MTAHLRLKSSLKEYNRVATRRGGGKTSGDRAATDSFSLPLARHADLHTASSVAVLAIYCYLAVLLE